MRYAVGIPTRNREGMLDRTIEALAGQTLRPSLVIVVDNNDEPKADWNRVVYGLRLWRECGCLFRTTGPEQGHQTALLLAEELGYDTMVRWDDDLVPEPDCMEKLVVPVHEGRAVACGGMYPRFPQDKKNMSFSSVGGSGDGNDRHLQFFPWQGDHSVLERKHLYSSFAYDVHTALRVGGFCPEYSRFGQRGETDFTLRLVREGRLLVDTSAVAWHHWSDGGRRASEGETAAMAALDNDLFRRRMIERKIDPDRW